MWVCRLVATLTPRCFWTSYFSSTPLSVSVPPISDFWFPDFLIYDFWPHAVSVHPTFPPHLALHQLLQFLIVFIPISYVHCTNQLCMWERVMWSVLMKVVWQFSLVTPSPPFSSTITICAPIVPIVHITLAICIPLTLICFNLLSTTLIIIPTLPTTIYNIRAS